jgi:hypothetical protein
LTGKTTGNSLEKTEWNNRPLKQNYTIEESSGHRFKWIRLHSGFASHQIHGMKTPAFTPGEEIPPPFSKWYNIGKALHFVKKRLAVPSQLRISGCRE